MLMFAFLFRFRLKSSNSNGKFFLRYFLREIVNIFCFGFALIYCKLMVYLWIVTYFLVVQRAKNSKKAEPLTVNEAPILRLLK